MIIGNVQKFSLIDYPGTVCATLFTQGCTFRCPYCHNPELVEKKLFQKPVPCKDVIDFLKTRLGKLGGVCITGGEPTVHGDGLIRFVEEIGKLGFRVKLDTNGSRPTVLKSLLQRNLLDYIAMDVKAPLSDYPRIVGAPVDPALIEESINLIMKSGLDYEFRTTVVKSLLSPSDLEKMGKRIEGARRYVLQKFRPQKTLNSSYMRETSYNDDEFAAIVTRLKRLVPSVSLR